MPEAADQPARRSAAPWREILLVSRQPHGSRAAAGRSSVALAACALLVVLSGGDTAPAAQASSPDLAAFVDPFIGTAPAAGAEYGMEFNGGDVQPGAVYPTGMLNWSPDTAERALPGGYFYADHTIKGFSLTHFSGRGCTAYQDVPILPIAGPPGAPGPVASFSHANESAEAGYYAVKLDSDIQVELAATPRTGLGRVTFPEGVSTGTLLVDAAGSVNGVVDAKIVIDADRQLLTGHVVSQVGCGTEHYTLYFAIAFDRPFSASSSSNSTAASVSFDTSHNPQVQLKPAISYVSVDNALLNLRTENPDWSLLSVRRAARDAWNAVLQQIQVSGGPVSSLKPFYTALYHSFLHPNLFNDVNGDYLGFDDAIHQVPDGHAHYANIPGWDQYRSLIQLRAILAPEQTSDILQSLVDDARQGGGGLPRWEQANRNSAGMVGDSPGPYIASAYAFGARDFDTASALRALDAGASVPGTLSGGHAVREWLEPWLSLGYIPEQPSITLEYATDDFAIGQFAGLLGDQDRHDTYLRRAANWINTFDPDSGYVEARDGAGSFASADHSQWCCGFVEGNAAQYTWMVAFDYPGLIRQLGGNAAAVARLDAFFGELNAGPNRPNAWIGNEPGLNAPWAYDFAGAPASTQAVVRRIQTQVFDATPGGLPGNDDGGATSAWYVFSALGIYPAVPGVAGLAIGSPVFEDAVVRLAKGQTLHIVGHGAATTAPYVQRLLIDGVAYDAAWIDWARLSAGATLEFTLGSTPAVQ